MSISVLITMAATHETETIPVVGDSELNSLWKPIIEQRGLQFLDYAVTAGLKIDAENYADVSDEIRVLAMELGSLRQYENDVTNPVFRCKRLLEVVERFPPESGKEIYIG